MLKKALIKFEGKIYWLDMGDEQMNGFEFDILDNGNWRPAEKTEVDLFSVMETGIVIGDKKPE